MPTQTIATVTVGADEIQSADRNVAGGFSAIDVQLTSPIVSGTTTDWDAKAGQGDFTWGLQYSTDVGATWHLLMGQTIPLGLRGGKSGLLPQMGIALDMFAGRPTRFRFFAQSPSVPVQVGAVATW